MRLDAARDENTPVDGLKCISFAKRGTPLTAKRVQQIAGGQAFGTKRLLSDVKNGRPSPLQPRSSGKAVLQQATPQPAERDPCVRRLRLSDSPALQVFQDENDGASVAARDTDAAAPGHSRLSGAQSARLSAAEAFQRPRSCLGRKRGRSLISGPPVRLQQQARPPLSPLVDLSAAEVEVQQPAKRQNIDGVPTPIGERRAPVEALQLPEVRAQAAPPSLVAASPIEQIDGSDAAAELRQSAAAAAAGPAPAPAAEPMASAAAAAAAAPAGEAAQSPHVSKVTVRRRRRATGAARPPPSSVLRRVAADRRMSVASARGAASPAALPSRSQLSVTAYHSQCAFGSADSLALHCS